MMGMETESEALKAAEPLEADLLDGPLGGRLIGWSCL